MSGCSTGSNNCNKCKGTCRCACQHRLCLLVGEINKVKIPCPKDECGCKGDAVTSRIVVKCPCGCPCHPITQEDVVVTTRCRCYVEIDLENYTDYEWMKCSSCTYTYILYVNGKSHLSGEFCLDWTFIA